MIKPVRLPNGSYQNPIEIDYFQVEKRLGGKNYYLAMWLKNGAKIDIETDLTETEAESRKEYWTLQCCLAEVAAYNEGYRVGLQSRKNRGDENGRRERLRERYAEGYEAGYAAGSAHEARRSLSSDAESIGVCRVLDYLSTIRESMVAEIREAPDLIEPRRQSLVIMLDVIEGVFDTFNLPMSATVKADASEHLARSIEELEISVRLGNCLRGSQIENVGDLVKKSADDLRLIPQFGLKQLSEVRDILAEMGLSLRKD